MTAIDVVRGEMHTWSDLGADVPAAGGPVLEQLVDAVVPNGAAVAIVGPHDLGLLDRVVARARTCTIVVRSSADAATIADRFDGPSTRVVCGDVLSASLAEPADVVLALDGLERSVSLEAPSPTWRDVFDHVVAFGAPSGTVVIATDNPLSLTELVAEPARGAADTDADWRVDELRDATRPPTAIAVGEVIAGATVLTAFPSARHATILSASPASLPPAVVIAQTPTGGRPDLREATRVALTAGRLAELAPSWIVVAGVDLGRIEWVVDAAGDVHDAESLAEPGTLYEAALLDACRSRDTAGVRDLARRLVDALRAADDLVDWQGATADNVLIGDDGTLRVLDPTAAGDGTATVEQIARACFDDVADRVMELGWRHPWPVAFDAVAIGRTLAAMSGIDPGNEIAPSRPDLGRAVPDASLLDVVEALQSRLAWFEHTLALRQQELAALRADPGSAAAARIRELERTLAGVEGSTSLRIGRAVLRPARVAMRAVDMARRRLRR